MLRCSVAKPSKRTSVQLIGSMMTGRRGICRPPSAGLPEIFPAPMMAIWFASWAKISARWPSIHFPSQRTFINRIILKVGTAEQIRAFFQPQSRVRFQFDAADEIISRRHDHLAAARGGAGIQEPFETPRCPSSFRRRSRRNARTLSGARDMVVQPICPSRMKTTAAG